jgi:F-type H+-transporting ATPase subunit b
VLLTLDNRIFGLDPQLLFNLVFQGIAIFLLFMAASRLLLDPVRKILEDRKARVLRDEGRGRGQGRSGPYKGRI